MYHEGDNIRIWFINMKFDADKTVVLCIEDDTTEFDSVVWSQPHGKLAPGFLSYKNKYDVQAINRSISLFLSIEECKRYTEWISPIIHLVDFVSI